MVPIVNSLPYLLLYTEKRFVAVGLLVGSFFFHLPSFTTTQRDISSSPPPRILYPLPLLYFVFLLDTPLCARQVLLSLPTCLLLSVCQPFVRRSYFLYYYMTTTTPSWPCTTSFRPGTSTPNSSFHCLLLQSLLHH